MWRVTFFTVATIVPHIFCLPQAFVFGDQPSDGANTESIHRLEYMQRVASEYKIVADGDPILELNLVAGPLLRFNDPVTGTMDAGFFLWTARECPAVAACFWTRGEYWVHEFQSLSASPLKAQRNGQLIWSPRLHPFTLMIAHP